ncbi:DUF924 family protein [Sessilibacter sp. MAH1]
MTQYQNLPRECWSVLDFWFRELTPGQWFCGEPELDQIIIERFSPLHKQACKGELDSWLSSARGSLALIIILDQFSRHLYRNSSDAFAQDKTAQSIAVNGIRTGLDRTLNSAERHFFYMPLMHAEDLKLQNMAIKQFKVLKQEAEKTLSIAEKHLQDIVQFGRFPYRNEALNRKSTGAERGYLTAKDRDRSLEQSLDDDG